MQVPIARPFLGEKEKEYVMEALARTELSGTAGSFLSRFEKEFSAYCGAKYGVAASNGTTALHLALAALGAGPGDEVIVATFTNMASVFAILYTGATPVAADIEPDTWNLDPALLESKITPRTKGIMAVHIYGHPADMDPILDVAKRHKLWVVEDAAEAHGAEYKGKRTGGIGDIGCFSFYANKIITTGEGGMVMMNDEALATKARSLGSLAYGPAASRFMHADVGFNYRMPNIIAAIGCAQLERIDEVIERKRAMAARYRELLGDLPNLQLPVEKSYAKNVYWMYHVVLRGPAKGKRAEVMAALKAKGIDTREGFTPMNRQRIFIERGLAREDDCPVANDIGANGFYIPSDPQITEEEQRYVADALREATR